jgi:hypothetical protein
VRIPSLALPARGAKDYFPPPPKTAPSPGQELHTNFKLEKNGGYLALVKPDGTPRSRAAWTYPAQRENSSYG